MKPLFAALIVSSMALTVYAVDKTSDSASSSSADNPTLSETKKLEVVAPAAATTSSPQDTGFVAHLQDLVTFHEKEIVSLKQMMDRWNSKVGSTVKRRDDLQQEVQDKSKNVEALQAQNTKISKKEADRIKKDIARVNKDIVSINKELKSLSKELSGEVRDVSRESQQALRDSYQQVSTDIQKSQN